MAFSYNRRDLGCGISKVGRADGAGPSKEQTCICRGLTYTSYDGHTWVAPSTSTPAPRLADRKDQVMERVSHLHDSGNSSNSYCKERDPRPVAYQAMLAQQDVAEGEEFDAQGVDCPAHTYFENLSDFGNAAASSEYYYQERFPPGTDQQRLQKWWDEHGKKDNYDPSEYATLDRDLRKKVRNLVSMPGRNPWQWLERVERMDDFDIFEDALDTHQNRYCDCEPEDPPCYLYLLTEAQKEWQRQFKRICPLRS